METIYISTRHSRKRSSSQEGLLRRTAQAHLGCYQTHWIYTLLSVILYHGSALCSGSPQ